MATITGDQIVFLLIAAILLFCFGNTFTVLRKNDRGLGEQFWLWGLIALAVSYLGYGASAWLGRISLAVANLGFLLSYIFLVLQLRFWRTGKSNIPRLVYIFCVLYLIAFETLRETLPYSYRATQAHGTIFILTCYLIWSSVDLYKKWSSFQIFMLAGTFALEAVCAAIRLSMFWTLSDSTESTTSLLSEPFSMVVVRWIWVLLNAISYLTLMTLILEKTFDRNDELQRLVKEKRQLLSAMSKITRSHHAGYMASALTHELSQPLAVLHLLSKNLSIQLKEKNTHNLENQIEMLCHESERSAKIMQQMNRLLRVRNADLKLVSISTIIDQALNILSPRIQENKISVQREGAVACQVNAEPTQLEMVFVNLISNAMASLSGQSGKRTINIECFIKENQCIVAVKDNGPGIDSAILENIGKLYVTDREQGTGIGLWLSNLIVTSHQGILSAQNDPNGGAIFTISLPITIGN